MSGLCKDCSYWRTLGLNDLGAFEEIPTGWGQCGLAKSEGNRRPGDSLAYAADAGEYKAWMITAPDFGCVQFERDRK